jgi:hypothetical protein
MAVVDASLVKKEAQLMHRLNKRCKWEEKQKAEQDFVETKDCTILK